MRELLILVTDVILLTDTINRQILILCHVPDIVMQEEQTSVIAAAHAARNASPPRRPTNLESRDR